MSAFIVKHKDPEYGYYAGANAYIADRMAKIDFLLKNNLVSPDAQIILKLIRAYLNQQRKAFFASVGCTEITKLGFIQGDPTIELDATAPASSRRS